MVRQDEVRRGTPVTPVHLSVCLSPSVLCYVSCLTIGVVFLAANTDKHANKLCRIAASRAILMLQNDGL